MPFLGVEQKKGTPESLDGRLTVYARVDMDPAEFVATKHPVASMIHNGLLAAQGNFRDQNSLRDFLRSEMGLSLEEGLEQLLSRLDGIESALDPERLKEKLQDMEGMEDTIPTPAKIVPFHSEEEILAQEGDVFFTGTFTAIGNAVLSVNAFPILYQARFREQVTDSVRREIEQLVGRIERNELPDETCATPGVDVEGRLVKEFIPNMLYCRKDDKVFQVAEKQFRIFMSDYQIDEDVDTIVKTIKNPDGLTPRHYRLLELYARKVAEMCKENFAEVERIKRALRELEEPSSSE